MPKGMEPNSVDEQVNGSSDEDNYIASQKAARDLAQNDGGVEDVNRIPQAHYESLIPKILSGTATPEERMYFYNSALGQGL